MLVLSRKLHERLVLFYGEGILVTVIQITRNWVILLIDAAPDVSIFRQELYEEIKSQSVSPDGSDNQTDLGESGTSEPPDQTRQPGNGAAQPVIRPMGPASWLERNRPTGGGNQAGRPGDRPAAGNQAGRPGDRPAGAGSQADEAGDPPSNAPVTPGPRTTAIRSLIEAPSIRGLKLSRRRDQSVIIDGGSIILTVVDIRGDKVRLGIHAPGILIHRQEVVFTILDEDANAFG